MNQYIRADISPSAASGLSGVASSALFAGCILPLWNAITEITKTGRSKFLRVTRVRLSTGQRIVGVKVPFSALSSWRAQFEKLYGGGVGGGDDCADHNAPPPRGAQQLATDFDTLIYSTYAVSKRVLKPLTKDERQGKGCSFAELQRARGGGGLVGPSTVFVSHAWTYRFQTLLRTVAARLR